MIIHIILGIVSSTGTYSQYISRYHREYVVMFHDWYFPGMADMSLLFLPEVPKEVLVSNSDIGDDRLGDEEWSVISSARFVPPNV